MPQVLISLGFFYPVEKTLIYTHSAKFFSQLKNISFPKRKNVTSKKMESAISFLQEVR